MGRRPGGRGNWVCSPGGDSSDKTTVIMAKSSKKPQKVRKPADPERARAVRRFILRSLFTLLLVGGAAWGYWALHKHVKTRVAYSPEPPQVVLVNRPPWMSDFLAATIAKSVRPVVGHSAMDHQMLVNCVELLKVNPWIKDVRQVRRVYGKAPGDTLEVDCDYRAPIALVGHDDKYVLVDGEGVVLPEQFNESEVKRIVFGHDGRTNIRIIEGVSRRPPAMGNRWQGEDLAAGLWMVKVLANRPFAEEIMKVDVSNYGGRANANNAHLVLITRYGTEVRWGQSHNWRGFEAPVERKLANLEQVFNHYGRVDAHQEWIDLRFDKVLRPEPQIHNASAKIDR